MKPVQTFAVSFTIFALNIYANSASAQTQRNIVVDNHCSLPLRIIVNHADSYQNWNPHGWFYFGPLESGFLEGPDGGVLTHSEGHAVYFYAETTDGSGLVWEGSDSQVAWEGTQYNLVEAATSVSLGDLLLELNCD